MVISSVVVIVGSCVGVEVTVAMIPSPIIVLIPCAVITGWLVVETLRILRTFEPSMIPVWVNWAGALVR